MSRIIGGKDHGGYGYTRDYPVEQLLRGCKIASIYEGTNGIQAMDLLGRKLGMKGGLVFMNYLGEIQKISGAAKKNAALEDPAARVDEAVNRLGEIGMHPDQINHLNPHFKTARRTNYPIDSPNRKIYLTIILVFVNLSWRKLKNTLILIYELPS